MIAWLFKILHLISDVYKIPMVQIFNQYGYRIRPNKRIVSLQKQEKGVHFIFGVSKVHFLFRWIDNHWCLFNHSCYQQLIKLSAALNFFFLKRKGTLVRSNMVIYLFNTIFEMCTQWRSKKNNNKKVLRVVHRIINWFPW